MPIWQEMGQTSKTNRQIIGFAAKKTNSLHELRTVIL